MDKPKLYIITGLPYAGKTTLARKLKERFKVQYASVDEELARGHYDIPAMSQQDWNDVYTSAYAKLEKLLQAGNSVVFDGASLKKSERQNLRGIAERNNAEPRLLYVATPVDVIRTRWRINQSTHARGHLREYLLKHAVERFEAPGPE